MRKARRRFVSGSVVVFGWSSLPAWSATTRTSIPPEAVLQAYVDVLIPGDETPSGTALAVDRHLLAVSAKLANYRRLLDAGLDWLNRQARADHGRNFTELSERDRESVVGKAAGADHNTLPRVFFERTRADAFFHYYGRRESWRGIPRYRGPPQPLGFADYTQPPRGSR